MKYGIREICNVVFKAIKETKIGDMTFPAGAPVLYIDSAKTSTVEGAATTVYATGGRGNNRLLAWEGERTLTFTVEDALLSPVSFAMLSGAGLIKNEENKNVLNHMTCKTTCEEEGKLTLTIPGQKDNASEDVTSSIYNKDIFVVELDESGDFVGAPAPVETATVTGSVLTFTGAKVGTTYFVDYYVQVADTAMLEMQIDAENFGGYYYVEANTLWRDKNGQDHAAELTIPKVKIQSNFSFAMAATGDPSTFTFTMDAFPAYTKFNKTKEVLMAIQVMHASAAANIDWSTVFDVPNA